MELKHGIDEQSEAYKRSFNRTFMELKQQHFANIRIDWNSFNRTFMELKLTNGLQKMGVSMGFNRTFMELKLV